MSCFARVFTLFTATTALAVAALGGCNASLSDSSFNSENGTPTTGDGPSSPTPFVASDSGAGPTQDVYRGSPLCRVMPGDCMPDDDGYHHATGALPCAEPAPDGGAADGGEARNPRCHLATNASGVLVGPLCETEGGGPGGDGASCSKGNDCAPGFDCVAGPNNKVCRRYCCLGSCGTQGSQSGGSTFCDVQRLVDTNSNAPVCLPLKHCALFGAGECAESETCAIVNENGASGCVTNGSARAGEPCDETHCSAGLSCLGQSGNRKCYELCKVTLSTCSAPQTCKTSALFKDPSFGVCQP